MMTFRTLACARAALAVTGGVALSFGLGCQPQDIYLFDRPPATTRADAGTTPAEPTPMSPPAQELADADPPREVPACVSAACESCVAREACSVPAAQLYCHPATARCSLPCDPGAAGAAGTCPPPEHCDPRIGLCVECVADEDCGGASPVCEPTRGECVACNSDPDCAASGGRCLFDEHRCVQCIEDEDCRVGDDDDDRCLPGLLRCGECLVDTDCTEPDRPFCSTQNECEDERE
jgi:hypothetical protein